MYLLFFGKSQSFTWEVFDEQGPATQFNTLFPGLEALESKMMTIDRRENPPVWARYRIKDHQGKSYSLLKVYAFAQAFDGSRIAGSTYGVALISDQEILWHAVNMDILEAARENFSKLVLQQQKFKKTNFSKEAQAIWEGMIHFQEGNLLKKVVTHPIRRVPSKSLMAVSFSDLKSKASDIQLIAESFERIYATTDLDHLLRMQEKWGRERFPIWGQVDAHPPLPSPPQSPSHHPKVQALLAQADTAEEEMEENPASVFNLKNLAPWLMALIGWGMAGYLYFQPKPTLPDPNAALRTWQFETFTQATKRDTLQNFLQNIRYFQVDSSQKYPEAILRDGRTLQLDSLTLETLLDRNP